MIPRVDYVPERHEYRVDGVVWPSVSRILRPLVEAEYAYAMRSRQEEMESAAVMGTFLALAIELDLAGTLNENDLDPRLVPRFESWREFRKHSGFEPLLCESIVVSKRYGYCGRLDLFGTLPPRRHDGKRRRLALVDTKATCSIIRTVRPQTAGYKIALVEDNAQFKTLVDAGPPIRNYEIERYALHLPEPPAKWKLVDLPDPIDERVFLARTTMFRHWENEK